MVCDGGKAGHGEERLIGRGLAPFPEQLHRCERRVEAWMQQELDDHRPSEDRIRCWVMGSGGWQSLGGACEASIQRVEVDQGRAGGRNRVETWSEGEVKTCSTASGGIREGDVSYFVCTYLCTSYEVRSKAANGASRLGQATTRASFYCEKRQHNSCLSH